MQYMNPGLWKFSLTVWNDQETDYLKDEPEKVEVVTIGLGTRECMDEVTLKLRPAEAKRLAEALETAAGRNYTPDSEGFEPGFGPNDIPVVGLFDCKFNRETCRYDTICCTCGHEWSVKMHERIEACPKCGVLAEDRW